MIRYIVGFLLLQLVASSILYEGRFLYNIFSSPTQEAAHTSLFKFMTLSIEDEDFALDPTYFGIDELILAATALIPTGSNDCDIETFNDQSAMGAKVKAINIIQKRFETIITRNDQYIDLLLQMIVTHIFHNEGLFERTIHSTFEILELSDALASPRIREPASRRILIPIFQILYSMVKMLTEKTSAAKLSESLSPSFIASMVPLLLSPIYEERASLISIFELTISRLSDEYSLEFLSASENFLDLIYERNLPLREINEIIRLSLLCVSLNKENVRLSKIFLDLVHSKIFPLHRHPNFFIISKNYANVIKTTLDKYYRNPTSFFENSTPNQIFPACTDVFVDHQFVSMCRIKFFNNLPKGDTKNIIAIVHVIENLTLLSGFFNKTHIIFNLKSLLKHINSSSDSSIPYLLIGILQIENIDDLEEQEKRKLLHLIWSHDFNFESPSVHNALSSYLSDTLNDLKLAYYELYREFCAMNGSRNDNMV